MTSAALSPSRRPAGRGLALLVLAVLVGVLAMHGLGPGLAPTKAPMAASGHDMEMAHAEAAQTAGDCSHTDGGMGHADATCAAAGVGAPYTPPALVPTLGNGSAPAALSIGAAGIPESGRAPPDLAELQLLRI